MLPCLEECSSSRGSASWALWESLATPLIEMVPTVTIIYSRLFLLYVMCHVELCAIMGIHATGLESEPAEPAIA